MIPLRASHVAFYAAVVTLTFTVAMAFGFWFIRAQMLTGNDFLLDADDEARNVAVHDFDSTRPRVTYEKDGHAHAIACDVAVHVIEILEVVQIEHDDG